MKIAKGTIVWILIPFLIGLILLIPSYFLFTIEMQIVMLFISIMFFILTLVFLIFFRDPNRDIGDGIVVCADGKIQDVSEIKDLDVGNCTRISTFMNIHNVHVNRMPIDGVIKSMEHKTGFHLPAFKKESEKNERLIIKLNSKIGLIKIVLIAGTLARRIVPYVKDGDKLKKGERIGIIRFGSRVDLYLPNNKMKRLKVKVGDRVKAGEDSIAEVND